MKEKFNKIKSKYSKEIGASSWYYQKDLAQQDFLAVIS